MMPSEILGEQAIRVALECAKQGGIPASHFDDCAVGFLYRKIETEDLFLPAWQGEEADKLTVMAETYVKGYLYRLRKRAKREIQRGGTFLFDGDELA